MIHDPIDFLRDRLDAIDSRIDRLESLINQVNSNLMTNVAKTCPAPGSCLELSRQTVQLVNKVDKLENRVLSLEKWQAWLTGIGAVLVVFATVFGPLIRKALNLE